MLRPIMRVLTMLVTFGIIAPQSSFSADAFWPGWLGPQRNGWVSDFKPPTQWPDELEQEWQVDVGAGYGSPLVAGDRIYLHARQGEDEVLWCLDRADGSVVWRKTHRVPFKMGGGGEKHGKGPKSCPMLADGRLFTMSITGILSAWNADSGALLWRRDYGPKFKNARDGNSHPYWGACGSPIVDGDRVVIRFGTDDEGELAALDAASGEVAWTLGNAGPSYSSPLIVEIHGVRQIVEWNHLALIGVEAESGRLLWEHPAPHQTTDQNMPTPVFHEGRVLLGGENRGIQSIEPVRDGDRWSVRKLWHQKDVALDMSTAVINDGLLYGFSHYGKGRLFCLEPKSGEILWQSPGRTGANATFLSITGYVVSLLDQGELRVIRASRDGYQAAASWQVASQPTWAPPVLLQDGVLIKDDQFLTLWSFGSR